MFELEEREIQDEIVNELKTIGDVMRRDRGILQFKTDKT